MRTARKQFARVAGTVALAGAMAGPVTGCGVTVDGDPAAERQSTTSGEQFVEWNPCSELPDEALQATGADPASKSTDFDAPGDRATWRMCAWNSVDGPYYIGVGATTIQQSDMYQNTSVTGITEAQINGRAGLTYYPSTSEDPIRACYVSLPMQGGMLNVYVDWRYSERSSLPEAPPCGLAVQHAQTLEPFLPE